jgi:hypothetical protein
MYDDQYDAELVEKTLLERHAAQAEEIAAELPDESRWKGCLESEARLMRSAASLMCVGTSNHASRAVTARELDAIPVASEGTIAALRRRHT